MNTDEDLQKSISDYGHLHRTIFVHRYDRALMILVLVLFVGSMILLIRSLREPQTGSAYQEWTIAVAGLLTAGMLLSFVSNLFTARILMQELERLKDQNLALGQDDTDDGTHSGS